MGLKIKGGANKINESEKNSDLFVSKNYHLRKNSESNFEVVSAYDDKVKLVVSNSGSKYTVRFIVTSSKNSINTVQVGKLLTGIEEAVKAAEDIERFLNSNKQK